MATKVIPGDYKGRPMFQIHIIGQDGEPRYDRPFIGFGVKKGEAILEHLDELKKFVEDNADEQSHNSNYR